MGKLAAMGIMCKPPRPGYTKTRLATAIGDEQAANLSGSFLSDVAAVIEAIPESKGRKGYGIYAPKGAETELRKILPPSFGLMLQDDADFGSALFGAIEKLLRKSHDCVCLINSDSPTLPASFLEQAIDALRLPGDRVVLGPTGDGGYYLIGLKKPNRRLFTDIPWGTGHVTDRTIERAVELDLEVSMLPEWYDVDDAESLEWLREELAGNFSRFKGGGAAAATRAVMNVTRVEQQ